MNIVNILRPQTIVIPLVGTEKREVVDELVDVLYSENLIERPDELKEVVWERETQRSTGIGEGLAIPHGKSDCATQLRMAIGCPSEPLEFDAIDRRPVRMIVLLASPPDQTSDHIQALGKISRLMSKPDFREAAYNAETAEALFSMFEEAERG